MEKLEKIMAISGWETGYYRPRTSRNGGDYWQFAGEVQASIDGIPVKLEVDDTSCGEFFTRWSCIASIGSQRFNSHNPNDCQTVWETYGLDLMALAKAARKAINKVAWETTDFHKYRVLIRGVPSGTIGYSGSGRAHYAPNGDPATTWRHIEERDRDGWLVDEYWESEPDGIRWKAPKKIGVVEF